MSLCHSPQLGIDYHSRMEGGLIGAVGRARERKRATLARETQERAERKRRRQQRLEQQRNAPPALPAGQEALLAPADAAASSASATTATTPRPRTTAAPPALPLSSPAGGLGSPHPPCRLLPPAEVAALLSDLNGGSPPSPDELLPVLLQCGADAAGQLPSQQLTAVVLAWNRVVRERGLLGLGGRAGEGGGGGGGGGRGRDEGGAAGGLCSGGCCSVS